MLKVLIAASEAVPFAKSGGLGDVAGSLPKALIKNGIDARVILPKYSTISQKLKDSIVHIKYIYVKVGWRNQYCGIEKSIIDGVTFYFIDNEYYFGRDKLYDYHDEAERFTFFSRAVIESIPHLDFEPDIIHCNDWQTGMIPAFLDINYKQFDNYRNFKTLFTIHNLQYQGVFPPSIMQEVLNLETRHFTKDKIEYYGNVSFMKSGIVFSDYVNTVSPTYAGEIQSKYFGEGLDELLTIKNNKLSGILNGIDYDEYNPENDCMLFKTYDKDTIENKRENKRRLREILGLPLVEDVPLIGVISRLVSQKGFDLIECVLNEILSENVQMVILGTGDPHYEYVFKDAVYRYPGKISANITFSNELAHRIYAASDMFLMPSKFEPCGLSQIISLRYGTIPVVRETGGLKDTIISYNEFTGEGNGFTFSDYNAHDMLYTIKRAAHFFHQKDIWSMLTKRGMECDFSWNASAIKYIELYERLIQ